MQRLLTAPIAALLAGCTIQVPSGIVDNHTKSAFDERAATAPDEIDVKNAKQRVFRTEAGDVGFVVGQDGNDLVAFTGISDADVGRVPQTGRVRYAGEWGVAYVKDLDVAFSLAGGIDADFAEGTDRGDIALTADFAAGTLAGVGRSGEGSGNRLHVEGLIADGALSGIASYGGRAGTLSGEVGADAAIGAFHTDDANGVLVGGFSAEAE